MTSTEALEALELTGEISPQAIKRQYRKMSLQCHPDRFSAPAEKEKAHRDFLRIKHAYDFLKNNPPKPATNDERRWTPKYQRAPGDDDLREWKRQFDKDQKEEERKEKERESDRLQAGKRLWRWENWRKILRVHFFVGCVAVAGALIKPTQAWKYGLIWLVILFLSLAIQFGG